LKFYERSTTYK